MITATTLRPLALVACAIATLAASPAGGVQPSRMRVATVEGVTGPVYYSVSEGRFLHIVPLEARAAPALEVASNQL